MSPISFHLPDEILLEILSHFQNYPQPVQQVTLAKFNLVNRQWYDVSIQKLYERPYLCGRGRDYELFVRTLCPSVIVHIKHTALAGLVKELDLKRLVHQSSKSTTARLLGRTKSSLETFIAPQASFAVNCWASLSKCTKLRILDLSLVSECISFQSLNRTLRQTPDLLELHLPRCSSRYESKDSGLTIRWPGKLQHVSLSGSISGAFLWSLLRTPESFPPNLYSLSILHCPGLDHKGIRPLLQSLATQLTRAELRDLPNVKHGRFNGVLDWLPYLTNLTIALDYIDQDFGYMSDTWSAARWHVSKPLEMLTLVTSGQTGIDPNRCFTATDLYALIDERFLGRLRYLYVAQSSEWGLESEGAEFEALKLLVVDELDRENWVERRWHYEGLQGLGDVQYEEWLNTPKGRRMQPAARILMGR